MVHLCKEMSEWEMNLGMSDSHFLGLDGAGGAGRSYWLLFAALGIRCFSGYSWLKSTGSRLRYRLFSELEMLSDAAGKQ